MSAIDPDGYGRAWVDRPYERIAGLGIQQFRYALCFTNSLGTWSVSQTPLPAWKNV